MRSAILSVLACLAMLPLQASAADAVRGRTLYEARCKLCHGTSVHSRNPRTATDFEGVRTQVKRWAGEAGTGWSQGEIDDVAVYLNRRYYRFRCPSSLCGNEQASVGPLQRTP